MKIKITEIEATAEDLRQSNTLAGGLVNLLRSAFHAPDMEEEDEDEEGEE